MTMKKLFNLFIFLLLFFTVYISYNVFISFRFQYIAQNDKANKTISLRLDEINSVPSIPNIGVTTIPIDASKARYFFYEGNVSKANSLLSKATRANPFIFYSEYVKASYFLQIKKFDSAYFYAKKAFYGWPKVIDHYKLFNQTLIQRKDTFQILQAFDSINELFYSRTEYESNFIESFRNAKLRYLITDYTNLKPVIVKDLLSEWQQVYEFESGEVIKLDNKILIDDTFFSNSDTQYFYDIKNDTISLYFKSSRTKVTEYGIKFSENRKILILQNVPYFVTPDSIGYQNQFFKKLSDLNLPN